VRLQGRYPHFEEHDTVVLGVSRDGADAHEKFSAKYRLPFLLLSDPNAEVCNAYGVFGTKSFLAESSSESTAPPS